MSCLSLFSKTHLRLLNDVRVCCNGFRADVRKAIESFDKKSREYIDIYKTHDVNDLLRLPVIKDVTFEQVVESCKPDDVMHFKRYAILLLIIAKVQDDALESIMLRIKHLKDGSELNIDELQDFDDDIVSLLQCYSNTYNNVPSKEEDDNIENLLASSSIGSLAKEIASELDDSDIQQLQRSGSTNPLALLQNEVMGKLMGRVTSKLTSKLQNGQLQHDQLLNEAMSLLGSLGGGADILSAFMSKSAQQGRN